MVDMDEPRCRPLSWREARRRLRTCLELYVKEHPMKRREYVVISRPTPPWHVAFLSWWIRYDLDVYFGAIPFSTGLLAIGCVGLSSRSEGVGQGALRPTADVSIYAAQAIAGGLLLGGALIGLAVVCRRRYLDANDGETAKRREIANYLRSIDAEEAKTADEVDSSQKVGRTGLDSPMNAIGTALNDVYPVYRSVKDKGGGYRAAWSRLPSLLLVQDDIVALQIGDIAPARCVSIDGPSNGPAVTLSPEQRITLGSVRKDVALVLGSLPRGRTTLAADSDDVLTLCNRMRVFRVLESPLHDFLRRRPGKYQCVAFSTLASL
jgi:hypothetical protein